MSDQPTPTPQQLLADHPDAAARCRFAAQKMLETCQQLDAPQLWEAWRECYSAFSEYGTNSEALLANLDLTLRPLNLARDELPALADELSDRLSRGDEETWQLWHRVVALVGPALRLEVGPEPATPAA